nr:hypothetical protein [Tanacetum cinerariifolium]
MSHGLSAGIAEVEAMSNSSFRKRLRSSYDSSPSPTLPSEDAKVEGPTTEDEDLAAGDEGLAARDEGPGMGVESHGLDDECRGLDDEGHTIESDGFGLGKEKTILGAPSIIPSPMISLTVLSPIALVVATSTAIIPVDEDQFIEERIAMTFVALWRPVLALEAWAGPRELLEMGGRVTVLEQERDRKER